MVKTWSPIRNDPIGRSLLPPTTPAHSGRALTCSRCATYIRTVTGAPAIHGAGAMVIAAGIQAPCHRPELLAQTQSGAVGDTKADEVIHWATPALYFGAPSAKVTR